MAGTSALSVDDLKAPLKRENELLRKARDAIKEQLKILRAEEVTIQRLIQAQLRSVEERASLSHSATTGTNVGTGVEYSEPTATSDTGLPQLDLELDQDPDTSMESEEIDDN